MLRCFSLCYVDGESLAVRIASGIVSITDAVSWTASVADTLDCVHQQSVIHRDIKPGNILLSADEKAYLTDFGLALRDHQLSSRFEISGTPKCMSPEQAQGESHFVDGRSDDSGLIMAKIEPHETRGV